jgi:DoxX-like family
MFTTYIVVTALAAVMTAFSAYAAITGAPWVRDNLLKYGVPRVWLVPLGIVKLAGAFGLMAGIGVPVIGIAAAFGLIVYFAGAIVTVVRARYFSHIAYPVAFLMAPAASLILLLISHHAA